MIDKFMTHEFSPSECNFDGFRKEQFAGDEMSTISREFEVDDCNCAFDNQAINIVDDYFTEEKTQIQCIGGILLDKFLNHIFENTIVCDDKIWMPLNGYYKQILKPIALQKYAIFWLMQKHDISETEAITVIKPWKFNEVYHELFIRPSCCARSQAFNGNDNLLNLCSEIALVEGGQISFEKHDENLKAFRYIIDAKYDINAKGERFENFLRIFIGEDSAAHQRFWECMGHLLFSNQSGKALVWMYGHGNDGKSELVRFLRLLFNEGGTYSSDITAAFDKHGPAYWGDARLVFLNEANKEISQQHIDMLKRLTGGDAITVNPKGKAMYEKTFDVKFLVTSNHFPQFAPGVVDEALKRRLQFIKVFSVSEAEKVEDLHRYLWEERDYFVTHAIEGFADLQNRGYSFSQCRKDEALSESVFGNDVAAVFLEDCCIVGRERYVFGNEFNEAAKSWLTQTGYSCSVSKLRMAIQQKGFEYKRFRVGNLNKHGFRGFSVK